MSRSRFQCESVWFDSVRVFVPVHPNGHLVVGLVDTQNRC